MFNGKTAVVTGAGSGIGRALAVALAKENCHLALIDINSDRLQCTSGMLKNSSITVSIHVADLSDEKQVCKLPEEVFLKHKRVDFLFNIAGVAAGGTFEGLQTETIEKAMRINFLSQVYMMKAFWSCLKKSPSAHIINMSSITGKAAFAKNSAYSASKFAVAGFTNSVACELENSRIKFSVVYPGAVSTDITDNAISFGGRGEPNSPSMIAKGISPYKAAEIILKGVKKGKREIFPGADAKLLSFLQRILPVRYWSIIKRYVRS